MWPDDRDLTAELAAGGVAARHRLGAGTVPDPAFASALRSQLMTADSAAVASLAPRPKRWTVADLFRGRRLAVTLAGALLIVAAGAAARTVLVRDEPAPVPPTPGISLPAVVVGELDGEVATATPSPTPTPTPSPSPTASPTPTPTASPTPSPTPTPVSTPKPTAKPAPKPTPIPTGAMALTASGCNGGVVLEWSKVVDERFNHYTTLRSTSASIPAAYPPQGGAVEVGGSYTMDAKATSAVDPSAAPGATLHYRTLAFDAEDRVIAVSPVRAAVAKPVAPLGPLGATPLGPDGTSFAWSAYGGPGVCYSYYKLVASESDPTPSYLEGSETWAAIADQEATSVTVEGIPSGTTWHVRLQAIRASSLGKIVVAQTDVLTWTAP